MELSGDEARQRELARLLYTVLDQHPHSAWGSVYWAFRHYEADRLMADHMYQVRAPRLPCSICSRIGGQLFSLHALPLQCSLQVFWEAHSRSCIAAAGADLIAEVEYLGVKSVRVSGLGSCGWRRRGRWHLAVALQLPALEPEPLGRHSSFFAGQRQAVQGAGAQPAPP